MRVDFHCHTIATKKDECKSRNVSVDVFKSKIELASVNMAAITNHNHFDKRQFILFQEAVKDTCILLPGVEIDVRGKFDHDHAGHVIVICDPNQIDSFSSVVSSIINGHKADDFFIDIEPLVSAFSSLNVIYSAHFNKPKSLIIDDINYLRDKLKDGKRLFLEPSNPNTIDVFHKHGYRAFFGSDVIDWEIYEKSQFGELRFYVNNFDSLIKLVQQDKLLLKDLLTPYFSKTIKVFGDSSRSKYPFDIPIYQDVNVIFGDKGSGKSEILKSLKDFYSRKLGDQVVYFEAGKEDEWFNEQTKNTDGDYLLQNLNITDDCSSEIKWIKTYKEITPTNLSDYKMYFSKSINNKAFERMLIKNTPLTNTYDIELKKYKRLYAEYKTIYDFEKSYKTFESFNSLDDSEKDALSSIINKLISNAFQLASDEWIVQKTSYFFDDMIEHIIEYASEDIASPVMPTSTKFVEFFRNRLALRINAEKLLDAINSRKIEKLLNI